MNTVDLRRAISGIYEVNFLSRNFMDDILVVDEELVDINYGSNNSSGNKKGKHSSGNHKAKGEKKSRKKLAIIVSSVAAVVIALGVTGFCVFGGKLFTGEDAWVAGEFKFPEGTTVSGISISGKTYEEAKKILESKEESFIKPLSISVDVNGIINKVTEKDFKYTYDIDSVLNEIKTEATDPSVETSTSKKSYSVTATVTEESVEEQAKKIAKKNFKSAENASVSKFHPYAKERFEYADATQGQKVNETDLSNQLKGVFASGASEYRIIADVEKTDAKITVDDLKKNIVLLSTYETVSTNTENGTENMRVSLKACNGSIIEPGATWSFNKCTGNSNLESLGYKPAGVISNGKSDIGIGGGICQSSSTIYNAAIRANMKVEERYCHKWASSYVPTGLDATIDYGNLDLKLSNPTEYQMFLECKVVDNTLYVSFWGWKSDSYDLIMTRNKLTDQGGSSYTVKAWRVYYKDGKEVDSESLGSSTYDTENGYVFIDADNDPRAKYGDDVVVPDETSSDDDDSSSSSSSSQSSYSEPSHSSSSSSSSQSSHSSSSSQSSHSSSSQSSSESKTDPQPEPKPGSAPSESESGEE